MCQAVIVTSSLAARNPQANVTGIIYLDVAGKAFPDAHWNDFPVIILGWWLGGFADLASGAATSFEASFMDGPFSFTLNLADAQTAQLILNGDESAESVRIDFPEFHASLKSVAAQVLQTCQSQGWSNSDLVQLEAALTRTNQ